MFAFSSQLFLELAGLYRLYWVSYKNMEKQSHSGVYFLWASSSSWDTPPWFNHHRLQEPSRTSDYNSWPGHCGSLHRLVLHGCWQGARLMSDEVKDQSRLFVWCLYAQPSVPILSAVVGSGIHRPETLDYGLIMRPRMSFLRQWPSTICWLLSGYGLSCLNTVFCWAHKWRSALTCVSPQSSTDSFV